MSGNKMPVVPTMVKALKLKAVEVKLAIIMQAKYGKF